jgi:DNA gyrase subunit A
LIERFKLSDIQARAVEMRLRQLTGLEQELRTEYEEIMKVIERLRALLADVNLGRFDKGRTY